MVLSQPLSLDYLLRKPPHLILKIKYDNIFRGQIKGEKGLENQKEKRFRTKEGNYVEKKMTLAWSCGRTYG